MFSVKLCLYLAFYSKSLFTRMMTIREVIIHAGQTNEHINSAIGYVRESKAPYKSLLEILGVLTNAVDPKYTPIQNVPDYLTEIRTKVRVSRGNCVDAAKHAAMAFKLPKDRDRPPHPTFVSVAQLLQSAQKKLAEGDDETPGLSALIESIRTDFNEIEEHAQAIIEKIEGDDGTKEKVHALGSLLVAVGGQSWFPELVDRVIGRHNPVGDLPAAQAVIAEYLHDR
jgi:hypothetical protein